MIAVQRQQRRALRTARRVGLELTLEHLATIADRIQHHHDHDDVSFIGRISLRVTLWRVRVGAAWFFVQYDTHRHAVDAFNAKESEHPDVDPSALVDVPE